MWTLALLLKTRNGSQLVVNLRQKSYILSNSANADYICSGVHNSRINIVTTMPIVKSFVAKTTFFSYLRKPIYSTRRQESGWLNPQWPSTSSHNNYVNKKMSDSNTKILNSLNAMHLHTTSLCMLSSSPCTNKTQSKTSADTDLFGDAANLGLFAKFKLMYKKYWYVLIPVHFTTSIGWFGAFYYLSKCGIDVPSILQYLHLSETIIERVKHSDMGHYAVAYLCYKVATPLRYALTLGGTTISIKYLVQAGHIKPMPTTRQLKKMYENKKAEKAAGRSNTNKSIYKNSNNSSSIDKKKKTSK